MAALPQICLQPPRHRSPTASLITSLTLHPAHRCAVTSRRGATTTALHYAGRRVAAWLLIGPLSLIRGRPSAARRHPRLMGTPSHPIAAALGPRAAPSPPHSVASVAAPPVASSLATGPLHARAMLRHLHPVVAATSWRSAFTPTPASATDTPPAALVHRSHVAAPVTLPHITAPPPI